MELTRKTLCIKARLSWALLWIAVIIFLSALIWGVLNPHMYQMRDTGGDITNSTAGESEAAQTGWSRIMIIWEYWPLWAGLGFIYYGFRRALNESQRTK